MSGLIVIGGPTGSGKSALALRFGEALGGVIINADSMQLYRELRILTARPSPADEARVPHRLYGILDAAEPASVAGWLELAAHEIDAANAARRVAIVVGGSGLYLSALLHGLAPVPEVPAVIRREARALLRSLGSPGLHTLLARRDPTMATLLQPSDGQRVARAYEVVRATGRSLADWQAEPRVRITLPEQRTGLVLVPPRAELYARVERRLRAMLGAGALSEVAALRARCLDAELPSMKALAVPELRAHLEGRFDLETALARSIMQTRRYAKRQLTWFRHQLPELQQCAAFGEDRAATPDPEQARRLMLTGTSGHHSVRCIKEPRS